jgi:hypothetical protein
LDALDASMPTPRIALSSAAVIAKTRRRGRGGVCGGDAAAQPPRRVGLGWVVFHARVAASL